MAIWLFVNQLNTFMIISYTSTDWLEVSHPGCWCQLALPVGSRPYTPWQDRCPSLSLARASCGWSRDGRNPRRMIDSGVSFPPLRTPSHSRDRPDGERRIQWWKERHDNSLVQALSEQFVQRCQTSVCFVSESLKGITAVILVFWTVLQCLFSTSALHTHSDLCVGSPVWRCHLISEPGSDSFGGAGAVLWHWLDHVVHPIQYPLGRVLMGR